MDPETRANVRQNWLGLLFFFASPRYQQVWVVYHPGECRSFDEDMCQYFDDLNLKRGLESAVEQGWLSRAEAEAAEPFHRMLDAYEAPSGGEGDPLRDPKWSEVVSAAQRAWVTVSQGITDHSEREFIAGLQGRWGRIHVGLTSPHMTFYLWKGSTRIAKVAGVPQGVSPNMEYGSGWLSLEVTPQSLSPTMQVFVPPRFGGPGIKEYPSMGAASAIHLGLGGGLAVNLTGYFPASQLLAMTDDRVLHVRTEDGEESEADLVDLASTTLSAPPAELGGEPQSLYWVVGWAATSAT